MAILDDFMKAQTAAIQKTAATAKDPVEVARAAVDAATTPLAKAQAMVVLNKTKIAAAEDLLTASKADSALFTQEAAQAKTSAAFAKSDAAASALRIADMVGGYVNTQGYVVAPSGAGGTSPSQPKNDSTATTARSLLRASLADIGIPASMIDSSITFVQALIDDGMSEADAVQIYYNNKNFTTKKGSTVESPFYREFTSLGEGSMNPSTGRPYTPKELMATSLGIKDLVKSYGASDAFASQESLKKYISNNVSVKDLDERFMMAKIKTTEADPNYVNTLKQLGYISGAQDLMDFYADNTIGQNQLETNRKTAAFASEALKRAGSGVQFNAPQLKQLAASQIATGASEGQIQSAAATGFENIAQQLQPTVGLSNIFEGKNAGDAATIQSELQAQEFQGVESDRQKRLKELGTRIMQGSAGTYQGRIASYTNTSPAGAI
jgi:hypothetical protein